MHGVVSSQSAPVCILSGRRVAARKTRVPIGWVLVAILTPDSPTGEEVVRAKRTPLGHEKKSYVSKDGPGSTIAGDSGGHRPSAHKIVQGK